MEALAESIRTVEQKQGSPAQWAERHLAAWKNPEGVEVALKSLILGLNQYGRSMRVSFGTLPSEDSFLGPAFVEIAKSILTLLNGDLGRFDGGSLDALVRAVAAENGYELDG